ncbi:MAG: AMP-binding protein [Bacteroidales bacterium]|nr:AMP-binding protein [Bacteroidales bacterium]MDD4671105.1 AMP-binding protein [Bacteroidales bacterium]
MIKQNLIQLYQESFRANAERAALTDYPTKETFTYLETAAIIKKLHLIFKEAGIMPGDKVALTGKNTARWVIAELSVMTYGAVIVPILQDFHAEDINNIINHSESKLLFVDAAHFQGIDTDILDNLSVILSIEQFDCIFERTGSGNTGRHVSAFTKNINKIFAESYPDGYHTEDIIFADVPNDKMMWLSYTSGTTGNSKGVMISGNSLASNILYATRIAKMWVPGGNELSYLPLAHAYGGVFDVLAPLTIGSHIYLFGKLPAASVMIKALNEVHPYSFLSVPLLIEKICKAKVFPMLEKEPIKTFIKIPVLNKIIYKVINNKIKGVFGGDGLWEMNMGGAAVDPCVEELLMKMKFPFTVGYGMTECGPLISYTTHSKYKAGSCGAIIPGMEVRIDSADPYTIPGEICVRGENVMIGYYKNEEATKAVLSEDGWLRTGDLGIIDKDMTIYIKGRCKTMILLSNGQNIYPEQIEFKLNNLDLVAESLVVLKDNKLIALVYPNTDEIKSRDLSKQEVSAIMDNNIKKLNSSVAVYEKITAIELRDTEFEKTPKKSIKRYLYTTLSK